jgi:CRISPR-associated RAMP protein (TIGR02581 family)
MFKKLINEASLSFSLSANGPLLINSSDNSKIDPTLPDMRFVRCRRNGNETVYLPGSSLKGVFRTRYEQLMEILGHSPCNITSRSDNCREAIKKAGYGQITGKEAYKLSCSACRLFGNLRLGSRIAFADAYPLGDVRLGMRNGVGIDRITGAAAAKSGAFFTYEVIESGEFLTEIKLSNFSRYQLRTILWILEDIDDGYVTFGMGGSRGNGHMKLTSKESIKLRYRHYGSQGSNGKVRGYLESDVGEKPMKDILGKDLLEKQSLFATEYEVTGLENIVSATEIVDRPSLSEAIKAEDWGSVLIHKGKKE